MNDGTITNWQNSALPEWYNKNMKNSADLYEYAKLFAFNKEDSLLDLGCGDATLLKIAAPLCGKVCGVDISDEQLARAKAALADFPNAELVRATLQEIDFPAESFTKVSMRKAIHHLTNHEKSIMIDKVFKWLKPGGIFIVEDMITSFEFRLKDEFRPLIEAEAAEYYGERWESFKDAFFTTMYAELPCDLSKMINRLLHGRFHIKRVNTITCFMCTIISQK